jgi:FtsH-binding integral membrane protein
MQTYLIQNVWVIYTSWALAFGVLIFMSCSTRARRKYPINYIFLIVFTLVFSVMTGAITARYKVEAIGIALAVTTATVLGAFCVAAFTKLDLTKYGGFFLAAFFGLLVMSLIAAFWRGPKCAPQSVAPACVLAISRWRRDGGNCA